jgi:hypothetical protein
MRFLFTLFFFFIAHLVLAQTLCTKFTIVKEVLNTEKVKVLVQPAVFESQWTTLCTKQGYWAVEYNGAIPCKKWIAPEYTQILEQIETKAAVYKFVEVQKKVRDAEVTAYLSEN